MKNLTIINMNGVLCIDSREIAEILEIEHKKFFGKIKGGKEVKEYIERISEKYLIVEGYFIPSTYQDKDGKTKKNFLITRLGCQFLAYESVGSVAVAFTATYIKNFNQIKPEYKKIPAAEGEELKRLLYYATAEGEGNLENYYQLRGKLAHKIVNKARGEKAPEKFVQNGKEYTATYMIECIMEARMKLKLSEEEFFEVYRIRIEQFQKAISQE